MIRHNDNVIPLTPPALTAAMERHPAGKGIVHFDADADTAMTRRYAGSVRCGRNAGRTNRTADPSRVTCKECTR